MLIRRIVTLVAAAVLCCGIGAAPTLADTSTVNVTSGGGWVGLSGSVRGSTSQKTGTAKGSTGSASTPAELAASVKQTVNLAICLIENQTLDVATGRCNVPPPGTPTPATPPKPSRAAVETVAISLIAQLNIPDPSLKLGPEPSNNEWNMAVVGLPVWLWTSEAASRRISVTRSGYTFTLTGRRTKVTYDPGDSTGTITCTATTPYPGASAAGKPSPTCGHTYQRPSIPGTYRVTARASWTVHWTALGYSGDVPLQVTSQRDVRVGELQSIRVA